MTDNLFGVSERALQLSEERATVLTNNIVNGSTPNFKARDMDFHKILQNQTGKTLSLSADMAGHITESSNQNGTNETLLFRVPNQANLDGNTVDEEIERRNFIQNSLNYQASLTFIKNKSDQLYRAIKGE